MCSSSISLSLLIYLSIYLIHTYNTHIDSLSSLPLSLDSLFQLTENAELLVKEPDNGKAKVSQVNFLSP